MRTLLYLTKFKQDTAERKRGDTELGLEKGGVGSYLMFKEDFEKAGLHGTCDDLLWSGLFPSA